MKGGDSGSLPLKRSDSPGKSSGGTGIFSCETDTDYWHRRYKVSVLDKFLKADAS